ncbi:MAG: pyridoxal-phosphate dependent enzyme, partial [Bacillota bacterium]|nr:pyridoxal-phosphate dependent enzyme [Bacillota bacterium]
SVEKAQAIAKDEGGFMPNQFENPANPRVHYETTGPEILSQYSFPDPPQAFVAGVGTGGTITGAGRRLLEVWPDLKLVAVEPKGSPVLSGGQPGPAGIPGIGAGFIPPILDRSLLHRIITVADEDAREWAYRLGREEGVLCGISSGAAFSAAREVAASLPEGAKVITVFPDSGERYLSSREGRESP